MIVRVCVTDKMKKTAIAAVVLLLVVLLAACGDGKETEETTTNVLSTTTAPVSANTTAYSNEVSNENVAMTYILTTQQGQTMPTVVTTLFNLENEKANEVVTSTAPDFSFTVPEMSAPQVVSSSAATKATTTQKTTSTKETEVEDTTAATKTRKTVNISGWSVSPDNDVYISIDRSGWTNGIKSGKITFVNVTVNGEKKTVKGYINGSDDGAGNATITVYTSSIIPEEGADVTVTIPAGSVNSKAGDLSNVAFSVSTSFAGSVENDSGSEASVNASATEVSETAADQIKSTVDSAQETATQE